MVNGSVVFGLLLCQEMYQFFDTENRNPPTPLFLTCWHLVLDVTMMPGDTQEIDSFSALVLFIQIAPSSWYSQLLADTAQRWGPQCSVADILDPLAP